MPISRFPFFNNANYYNNYIPYYGRNSSNSTSFKQSPKKIVNASDICDKKNNSKREDSKQPCFFELFGLKLYFDDILLICLIFFLYDEGVKDDELFISLILLLLS